MTALRQFIEVDNQKALVSVRLLDQHRVVDEVVGSSLARRNFPDARRRGGPTELAFRAGERKEEARAKQVEPSACRFRVEYVVSNVAPCNEQAGSENLARSAWAVKEDL